MLDLKPNIYYSGIYYSHSLPDKTIISIVSKPIVAEAIDHWHSEVTILNHSTGHGETQIMRSTAKDSEDGIQTRVLKFINRLISVTSDKEKFRIDFIPVHGDRDLLIVKVKQSLKLNIPIWLKESLQL